MPCATTLAARRLAESRPRGLFRTLLPVVKPRKSREFWRGISLRSCAETAIKSARAVPTRKQTLTKHSCMRVVALAPGLAAAVLLAAWGARPLARSEAHLQPRETTQA